MACVCTLSLFLSAMLPLAMLWRDKNGWYSAPGKSKHLERHRCGRTDGHFRPIRLPTCARVWVGSGAHLCSLVVAKLLSLVMIMLMLFCVNLIRLESVSPSRISPFSFGPLSLYLIIVVSKWICLSLTNSIIQKKCGSSFILGIDDVLFWPFVSFLFIMDFLRNLLQTCRLAQYNELDGIIFFEHHEFAPHFCKPLVRWSTVFPFFFPIFIRSNVIAWLSVNVYSDPKSYLN